MPNIRIVTVNARSVKNKDQITVQEHTNNDIDAALITETWAKDTQEDLAWLNQSELCQGPFEISTHNRLGKKGWWYCINLWQEQQHKTSQKWQHPNNRVCNMEIYYQEQTFTHNWNLPTTTNLGTQYNKWDVHQWHHRTTSQQAMSIPK